MNLFLIIFTFSERHMCTSFLWQTNTKSCNYRFIMLLGTPEKSAGIPRTAKYLSFPLIQLLSSNWHHWHTTDIYKEVVLIYKFEMHHQYLIGNVLKINLQTPKWASILCAAETISPNKNYCSLFMSLHSRKVTVPAVIATKLNRRSEWVNRGLDSLLVSYS